MFSCFFQSLSVKRIYHVIVQYKYTTNQKNFATQKDTHNMEKLFLIRQVYDHKSFIDFTQYKSSSVKTSFKKLILSYFYSLVLTFSKGYIESVVEPTLDYIL